MSEENVEIVRRIYEEGLIYRDPEGLVAELGTPDIEYVNPPYAVEPGTRRGPAEVAKALRRAHELFASLDTSFTTCSTAAMRWSPFSAFTRPARSRSSPRSPTPPPAATRDDKPVHATILPP
jgi:hypothetical protein